MTALVRPPCTTEVADGLCVFPYFAVPHSIIRYQRAKCSSTIPRARATCTAHIYSGVVFSFGFVYRIFGRFTAWRALKQIYIYIYIYMYIYIYIYIYIIDRYIDRYIDTCLNQT
jgi:hypothetical protein